MYQRLLGEVSDLRQGNRRRIRKGLWALVGVTVGLLVRRPFMGLNRFMEEKLEETELL